MLHYCQNAGPGYRGLAIASATLFIVFQLDTYDGYKLFWVSPVLTTSRFGGENRGLICSGYFISIASP
jgi:hypothetical protein